MSGGRRRFLGATAAAATALCAGPLLATVLPELLPPPRGRRVVIVGGGWGGLAAARHLRETAPELEVVLLERNAAFHMAPLGNKWLVGLADDAALTHDYRRAAGRFGYTFVQAAVEAIERDRRRIVTAQGSITYDWLILAAGIRYSFSAWYGDDRAAIAHTLRHYPCAFVAGDELPALKRKLATFAGGDLLMTIPPAPYRCPPAPFERACLIAWQLQQRGVRGRLIVLDAGSGVLGFPRIFAEHFAERIVYRPNVRLTRVDPHARIVATEFEEFRFDDAILMPPQQAADIVWQAGLIGRDEAGRPTGWADPHPVLLNARDDERVLLIGDLMGRVSPLFGHYTKTGQTAAGLGRIAAAVVAARARDRAPERQVPDSVCHVVSRVEPRELIRVETQYQLRDGDLISQTSRQARDPQPRDEDGDWARTMLRDMLGLG
jgi:NADPH-dependent 2,4-dienoyl-CoA reductase/sulfur reductase-like enzyme